MSAFPNAASRWRENSLLALLFCELVALAVYVGVSLGRDWGHVEEDGLLAELLVGSIGFLAVVAIFYGLLVPGAVLYLLLLRLACRKLRRRLARRALALVASPLVGAVFIAWELTERDFETHVSELAGWAFLLATTTLFGLVVCVPDAGLTVRQTGPKKSVAARASSSSR